MWGLTRWWHDSSLSAVMHFVGYCIGATLIVLQTPTKWHLPLLLVGWLQQEKAAGSLKRRGRQCDHQPPKTSRAVWCRGRTQIRPASLLLAAQAGFCRPCPSSCCLDWVLGCLPSMEVFMRRGYWLISLFPSWGYRQLFFLASSQAPVWEGWHADATFQIDGVPKILQPMPEMETLHVRYLMQGKNKPFYKHVNFFCLGYFSSANYEIRRLGRRILPLPLWGHRPQRSSYT